MPLAFELDAEGRTDGQTLVAGDQGIASAVAVGCPL